ncbi:PAS domain-containing protein [Rhodobium gokarnense]|uniref:PAS domain-containing protein n=1 Tax=Rhodobium gokarnense TaxID=364296 RepID=UPI003873BE43
MGWPRARSQVLKRNDKVHLSGVERTFPENDIIVSKTDLKGNLTYANKIFIDISGYTEKELIGQPHSILRNPQMPRVMFKVLWCMLQSGSEIFAYVVNRCKNGDHYWVYAHATPSFDMKGNIIGYHSNRRVPDRRILEEHIIPLYAKLREEEHRHASAKDGLTASTKMLESMLDDLGMDYDEFIATVGKERHGSRPSGRRRQGYDKETERCVWA